MSVPRLSHSVVVLPPAFQDLVDSQARTDDVDELCSEACRLTRWNHTSPLIPTASLNGLSGMPHKAHTCGISCRHSYHTDCLSRRSVGPQSLAMPNLRRPQFDWLFSYHTDYLSRRSVGNASQGLQGGINHHHFSSTATQALSGGINHRQALIRLPTSAVCWASHNAGALDQSSDCLTRRICQASQSSGMATTVQSTALCPSLSTLSCGASSHQTPITLSPPSTPNTGNDFNSSVMWLYIKVLTTLKSLCRFPSSGHSQFICPPGWALEYHGSSSLAILLLCSVTRTDACISLGRQHLQLSTNYPTPCLSIDLQFDSITVPTSPRPPLFSRLPTLTRLTAVHRVSSTSAPPDACMSIKCCYLLTLPDGQLWLPPNSALDTPFVVAALLLSGLSMPTVTLLCHYALNSLCSVPAVLIKVGTDDRRFPSLHRRSPKTSVGDPTHHRRSSSALKSTVGAVPLTDGCRFLTSHTLSPSSLLPFRILSIHRPALTTSANSALKLPHRLNPLAKGNNTLQTPHRLTRRNHTSPLTLTASLGGLSGLSLLRWQTCVAPSLTGSSHITPIATLGGLSGMLHKAYKAEPTIATSPPWPHRLSLAKSTIARISSDCLHRRCGASSHQTPVTLSPPSTPNTGNGFNNSFMWLYIKVLTTLRSLCRFPSSGHSQSICPPGWALEYHGSSSPAILLLCSVTRMDACIRLGRQHLQLPANYPTPCLSIFLQFGNITVPTSHRPPLFFRLPTLTPGLPLCASRASMAMASMASFVSNGRIRVKGCSCIKLPFFQKTRSPAHGLLLPGQLWLPPNSALNTPIAAAALLRSGLSMPTVTLLCHYALNSLCSIPTVLIKKRVDGRTATGALIPMTQGGGDGRQVGTDGCRFPSLHRRSPKTSMSIPRLSHSVAVLPPAFRDLVDSQARADDVGELCSEACRGHTGSQGGITQRHSHRLPLSTVCRECHTRLTLAESHTDYLSRRFVGPQSPPMANLRRPQFDWLFSYHTDCLSRQSVGNASQGLQGRINHCHFSSTATQALSGGINHCQALIRLPTSAVCRASHNAGALDQSFDCLTRWICRESQSSEMATTVQSTALCPGLSTLSCRTSSHQTPVTLSPPSTPNTGNNFNSSVMWLYIKVLTTLRSLCYFPSSGHSQFIRPPGWALEYHGSSSLAILLLCSVTRTDACIRLGRQHLQLPANYPTPCLSIVLQFGNITVPTSPRPTLFSRLPTLTPGLPLYTVHQALAHIYL
eukprot:Gb_32925 [translate_table: standard]